MTKLIDITGNKYGLLVVIGIAGKDSTNKTTWHCLCECGNGTIATGLNLKTGTTQSCGCLRAQPSKARLDLTGTVFGRLTAIKINRIERGQVFWDLLCSCGNSTVTSVGKLRTGRTQSCGCFARESSRAVQKKYLGKSGPLAGNWKSELSEEDRKRFRTVCKNWKKRILDNNKYCIKCNSETNLQVHHIFSYRDCKERRDDYSNGVVLCKTCHKEFHKTYGYTGFSRSDLFDYIKMEDPGDFSVISLTPEAEMILNLLRRKPGTDRITDLRKAQHYLARCIEREEAKGG